jgi:hypothetical protein
VLQPVQSQQDGRHHGQRHLRKAIVVTDSEIRQVAGQTMAPLQPAAEFLKEEHSAGGRQTAVIPGAFDIARPRLPSAEFLT